MYVFEPLFLERWLFRQGVGDYIIILEDCVKWYFFMITVDGFNTVKICRFQIYGRIENSGFYGQVKQWSVFRMKRYLSSEDVCSHTFHEFA